MQTLKNSELLDTAAQLCYTDCAVQRLNERTQKMNAKIENNIKTAIESEFGNVGNVSITARGDGMYIAEFDGMTKWIAADEKGAAVLPDFDPNDSPMNY